MGWLGDKWSSFKESSTGKGAITGATYGSAFGPIGTLGGAAIGAGAGYLAGKVTGGGDGGNYDINQGAFQMNPEQQQFAEMLRQQAMSGEAPEWMKQQQSMATQQLQAQQQSMAASASSANRGLAQRQAGMSTAKGTAEIAGQTAALAAQWQQAQQQQYMAMIEFEKQLGMAYEKLRSGQELSLEELALTRRGQNMQMAGAMAQAAGSLIGRAAG